MEFYFWVVILFFSRADAYLQIEAGLDGTWKFPLKLVSIDAPPDDTVIIEGFGLNKESVVGFRLSSKSEYLINF